MLNTLITTAAVAAEAAAANFNGLAGIGTGIAVFGAGFGIGKIAAAANDAIARQPEAAGEIRGSSLILSALIEGVALFGVAVTLLFAL